VGVGGGAGEGGLQVLFLRGGEGDRHFELFLLEARKGMDRNRDYGMLLDD